jgi:hypothetical protein
MNPKRKVHGPFKCLAIYSYIFWDLSFRIGSENTKTFLRTKLVFSFFLSFFQICDVAIVVSIMRIFLL